MVGVSVPAWSRAGRRTQTVKGLASVLRFWERFTHVVTE